MIIVPVITIFLLWLLFVVNPIVMGQIIHTKQQKVRFFFQIINFYMCQFSCRQFYLVLIMSAKSNFPRFWICM